MNPDYVKTQIKRFYDIYRDVESSDFDNISPNFIGYNVLFINAIALYCKILNDFTIFFNPFSKQT